MAQNLENDGERNQDVQHETGSTIPGRPRNRDHLLTSEWYVDFPQHTRDDVEKINELMKRRPYLLTLCFNTQTSDSVVGFKFQNNYQINSENWADAMRRQLAKWSSAYDGLVMSPNRSGIQFKVIKNVSAIPMESVESDEETDESDEEMDESDEKTDKSEFNLYKLHTNEDLPDKCPSNDRGRYETLLKEFARLSENQKKFVTKVRDNVILLSKSNEPDTKRILLECIAGTGKTATLGCLRYIGNSNIFYVAESNTLCNYVKMTYNIQTFTFCSFIMDALNMDFSHASTFIDATSYISSNEMLEHHFSSVRSHSFQKLLQSDPAQKYKKVIGRLVNIIFLDEFSIFAPGTLECFVQIIKTASKVLHKKFIIILSGNAMLIPPMRTASMNYEPLRRTSELACPFTQQFRIDDEEYQLFINRLFRTQIVREDPNTYFDRCRNGFPPEVFRLDIDYSYEFAYIDEKYNELIDIGDFFTWLKQPDFFNGILSLSAFTSRNRDMHYTNLGLAFSIISQLRDQNISMENINRHICFSTFTAAERAGAGPILEDDYTIVPCLPLIRFFPYRLLVHQSNYFDIPRKSIVYLICWNLKKGYVEAYCPDVQKLLTIPYGKFRMNSSSVDLLGIPLEMAFATTFHLAQGRTITGDVILALNKIDCRELLAILTRIRRPSQIKNIYVSPDFERIIDDHDWSQNVLPD